jgi:hypothetical protein
MKRTRGRGERDNYTAEALTSSSASTTKRISPGVSTLLVVVTLSMPSTPDAYPQVVSSAFQSLRVVHLESEQVSSISALGSIPGSSTREGQVRPNLYLSFFLR